MAAISVGVISQCAKAKELVEITEEEIQELLKDDGRINEEQMALANINVDHT